MNYALEDITQTTATATDSGFPTGRDAQDMGSDSRLRYRYKVSPRSLSTLGEDAAQTTRSEENETFIVLEENQVDSATLTMQMFACEETDSQKLFHVEFAQTLARFLIGNVLSMPRARHIFRSLEMLESLHSGAEGETTAVEALRELTKRSSQLPISSLSERQHVAALMNWCFEHAQFRRLFMSLVERYEIRQEDFEDDESQLEDVVGLKIPRKRVLATLDVSLDVRELPRRKPHVISHAEEEES